MSYHMRFFDLSPQPLTFAAIETALRVTDPGYRLDANGAVASLWLSEKALGEMEIHAPGDGAFERVVGERVAALAASEDEYREAVEAALHSSRQLIQIRLDVLEEDLDDSLEAIDPLWDWLFDSREGLLHAEGEGYYQDGEMLLEEE